MERTPQQWVYSALVGMSLLLAGWLWQIVNVLRDDVHHIQDTKADKAQVDQKASDRWTGSQQAEYRAYVDARLAEMSHRMEDCRQELEQRIAQKHPKS